MNVFYGTVDSSVVIVILSRCESSDFEELLSLTVQFRQTTLTLMPSIRLYPHVCTLSTHHPYHHIATSRSPTRPSVTTTSTHIHPHIFNSPSTLRLICTMILKFYISTFQNILNKVKKIVQTLTGSDKVHRE